MKRHLSVRMIGLMLTAAILMMMGCSKLTTENYDRLELGMAYAEVVELLGKADTCSGAVGLKKCRWGNGEKQIVVSFAGDKVVLFSAKGL